MTDTTETPPGEPAATFKMDGDGPISLTEAANAITKAREAPVKPEEETPPSPPEDKAPEVPPAESDDTAPPEEAPGDATQEAEPAEELPPIDPPRSWTKEEKAEFATYPREAQEKIARREQERETFTRRSQNEAAEQRRALEAERQQTAQARQQYEQALPQVLAAAQAAWDGEFSDIKSWADAEQLQKDDFVRYQRWDLLRQKAQSARSELDTVQRRQAQEVAQNFNTFAKTEDAKFTEQAPEMADPAKARALRESASKALKDLGFRDEELTAAWDGRTGVSMRDHRVQLLIRKAALWDEAQAKAKQVRQAPVPPVQRPGTARSTQGDADTARAAKVRSELKTASGRRAIELATELQQLTRSAS